MSFTGCNNEWQSFAKLSYSAINNVLTSLLQAGFLGLLSGAQRLECDKDSEQTVWVHPRSNSPLGLSLRYLALPIFFQLATQENNNALSSLVNGLVFIFRQSGR